MVLYCVIGETPDLEDYHDRICDACKARRLVGNLYECNSCSTTLCQECYGRNYFGRRSYEHNQYHPCRVTPCHLDRLTEPQHAFDCVGCKSVAFLGPAFHCAKRPDRYFCERCRGYAKCDVHPEQSMQKIEPKEVKSDTELKRRARAIRCQQDFGDMLAFPTTKNIIDTDFGRRIGYFIYGDPTINAETSGVSQFGYKPEEEEKIRTAMRHCEKLGPESQKYIENSLICIQFYGKDGLQGACPILKVHTPTKVFYLEPTMRTYDSWTDFVENNEFPKSKLICPRDGEYTRNASGKFLLEIREAAACDTPHQLVRAGDVVSIVGATVGTGLALASLVTPLGPIFGGALATSLVTSTVWGSARSAGHLVDRGLHKQSINPLNKEAFFDWFSLVSSAVSCGSMGAVSLLAKSAAQGVHISRTAIVATDCLIFGSLGINGVGCAFQIVRFAKSWLRKDEKVDPLQVFQMTAQILFFYNAAYPFTHATKIIREVQSGRLDWARNHLPTEEERLQFDAMISDNREQFGDVRGNQLVLHDVTNTRASIERGGTKAIHKGPQRHAAMPKVEEGRFSQAVIEAEAIKKSDMARATRYGGKGGNKVPPNTVFIIDPQELQNRVLAKATPEQLVKGDHHVQLDGTFRATNVVYDPSTRKNRIEYVEIGNPAFTISKGIVAHYAHGKSRERKVISAEENYSQYRPEKSFKPRNNVAFPVKASEKKIKRNEKKSEEQNEATDEPP